MGQAYGPEERVWATTGAFHSSCCGEEYTELKARGWGWNSRQGPIRKSKQWHRRTHQEENKSAKMSYQELRRNELKYSRYQDGSGTGLGNSPPWCQPAHTQGQEQGQRDPYPRLWILPQPSTYPLSDQGEETKRNLKRPFKLHWTELPLFPALPVHGSGVELLLVKALNKDVLSSLHIWEWCELNLWPYYNLIEVFLFVK